MQFPNAVQLYRIILHPRLGSATLTHKVTSSALYGSNDGIHYVKVMGSNEHVDKVVTIDFNITRPCSYFKLEVMETQQFGLSQMEMFEATFQTTKLVVGGGMSTNILGELQLDQNVYRHSTILGNNWTKFLPVTGWLGADYRITDSGLTVAGLNSRPSVNTDVVDKLYVDQLTAYVSGGGITTSSTSGLKVDNNNIHLYVPGTTVVSTYVNKSIPVIGVDSSTSERYISDSHFTILNFGHVPTVNTDVVNKGYFEWLYLTKADFDKYIALPGIPITSGLAMAFIPTL